MKLSRKQWFLKGMKDGIPIMLGYFAVSFALGIAARNAGLSAFQAGLGSALITSSTGESIGFSLIAASAGYFEVFLMEAIANARYLLMSCALSQKLAPDLSIWHRCGIGFFVTDEIFGVSVAVPDMLEPCYTYGVSATAWPGWIAGTVLGVLLGNVLPVRLVSALSVGLYGMFISIFMPPARKDKVIAGLIIVSFALSYAVNTLKVFDVMSAGTKIILLTVVISLAASLLFPVKKEAEA